VALVLKEKEQGVVASQPLGEAVAS
jgi:hypothetical protein